MKTFFAILFVFAPNCILFSQSGSSIIVSVTLKTNQLKENEDFIFKTCINNKSNKPLFVSPFPVLSSVVGKFGDIQIKIQRLEDSCYKTIDIDEDPWGVKFDAYSREIKSNDSISHKIDLRGFGFMKKGFYRLKIFYDAMKEGVRGTFESNWAYLEVSKYVPKENPTLFREEK